MKKYFTCVTIAGSDSGGGAGIQADLKTMSALGVYGMSAVTAVTAQNTCGVLGIQPVDAAMVEAQLDAVLSDIGADAVKTGMLCNRPIVEAVVGRLNRYRPRHLVIDPVMLSTSGHRLLDADAAEMLFSELCPQAAVVTPNIDEAAFWSGIKIEDVKGMYRAAEILLKKGCRNVLIKGGHLSGNTTTDLLFGEDVRPTEFSRTRIETVNTHGTGCTLSAAIAACLARGEMLPQAVALSG
ncbi:MAG: bifunctional hydroxymethylpyrimidine kinase/phosphomethylpyrimidine kinase, partial [Coprobacter sp.]|nr:bifunctional hydroxymethylpyrimidine kinase/phosphomethylpyrimidine kinase [Coprobacter sp.]